MFTVRTRAGDEKNFVIMRNKGGRKWLELWADYARFEIIASAIRQDPDVTILDESDRSEIQYIRQGCKFVIEYVDYVDVWINPHWDGVPFIDFEIVEIGHPDFVSYANEAMRLCSLIYKFRA